MILPAWNRQRDSRSCSMRLYTAMQTEGAWSPDSTSRLRSNYRPIPRAQVLEAKLRYAIHNCLAIDADDTSVGRHAAGMGWGEEP